MSVKAKKKKSVKQTYATVASILNAPIQSVWLRLRCTLTNTRSVAINVAINATYAAVMANHVQKRIFFSRRAAAFSD